MTTASDCFHCGLQVPPYSDFRLAIDGQQRDFCCPGCQAVAAAIVDGGLEQFYRFRTASATKPEERAVSAKRFEVYNLAEVQLEFVHALGEDRLQASLLLEGITCAACVWLIEHHLGKLAGVMSVRVNATTHRCLVDWQPSQIDLSDVMVALESIGYHPIPATEDRQQAMRQTESRRALMRLAVAGFGMMQVMMVAVALYSGADASWEGFFRWLSFIIATPVVFFSARPFFAAAKRSLLTRHLTMDVPVSLAIGGAYLASTWATVFGGGEVYFDSVSMFTFFLLLGRYLEMRARHRNGIASDRLAQLLPVTVERMDADGGWQPLPLSGVSAGDLILVPAGTTIACDGVVEQGRSAVVETLLTGEPDAIDKQSGDQVIAGTLNTDSALQIRVSAVGASTRLSAIERMVEQAQQDKPAQVAMADRLAGYFVAAVLVVSAVVGAVWWQLEPGRAVWVTLSILVVTCPCALSLASPAALTSAVGWLRQRGLLVTRGHVLEGLNHIDRVIFDKTGTLTLGSPQVVSVVSADDAIDEARLLEICAALETGSTHPIAKAFAPYVSGVEMDNVEQTTGAGVSGVLEGDHYRLGKPAFACAKETIAQPEGQGQWLLLSRNQKPLAWIQLHDQLRESALPLVKALRARGLSLELLSGDAEAEVSRVAAELEFEHWRCNCSPDDKLAHIRDLQNRGQQVMMVGDGINDVPVLSGAFVSVAMGGATDLAQTRADSVLLGRDLRALARAFDCAALTRRIIRQNLSWAIIYNLLALPLAAAGWIPPWAAAIGMSLSSLVVVGNALRIGRRSPEATAV
ncbi:cadmium-translocating P-type ATPase [Pseudomaricurvus alkylphenolicus]|uniref:heavy metal translocating P-type ATPase metal-binding domain-containing protein n=1 Tax=Pseudomaricurvus alkylphenolicus TaxID=1306991 RepID=UPI00141FCB6D|nr:cadmium-translocating P-type ATPase [Pseudomaricurvus alkylphenolicus]